MCEQSDNELMTVAVSASKLAQLQPEIAAILARIVALIYQVSLDREIDYIYGDLDIHFACGDLLKLLANHLDELAMLAPNPPDES